jgi:hypothetical protein
MNMAVFNKFAGRPSEVFVRITTEVERRFASFDQQRRNARVIGEIVANQIRNRSVAISKESPDSTPPRREMERREPSELHQWTLASATELLEMITELNEETLNELLDLERRGRSRPAVISAIEARLASDNS